MNRPCSIAAHVLRRTGSPKWWCTTHYAPAWGKAGERLERCGGARERTSLAGPELELDIERYPGGIALWGALPPVFDTSIAVGYERGIHVHARRAPGGCKEIDTTYSAVRVIARGASMTVIEEDAVNYVASVVFDMPLKDLRCSHCRHAHLDAGEFAVRAHRKHLCNRCGRHFYDPEGTRAVGNPLMGLKALLGDLAPRRPAIAVDRQLIVDQRDLPGGLQIWTSNPAIIWTAPRQEEDGIHVHGYDEKGRRLVDDTFCSVVIDGWVLDASQVRTFMAQRSLEHLASRVTCLICSVCGKAHFDEGADATNLRIERQCKKCGQLIMEAGRKKKVVSNPFVAVRYALLESFVRGVSS